MNRMLPAIAAIMMLPACETLDGARDGLQADTETVENAVIGFVDELKEIPLPNISLLEPSPFTEMSDEVRAYCEAVRERWEYGRELVETGDQLIAEGQARLANGQQLVRDGERRIDTGELALEKVRRELGLRTGRIRPSTQDFEALEDPKIVRNLRAEMKRALERMKEGGQQVKTGASEIAIGRERTILGLERFEVGHSYMADDDGRCRNFSNFQVIVDDPIFKEESN